MTRRSFAQRILGAMLAYRFGFIFDLAERAAPVLAETYWEVQEFTVPLVISGAVEYATCHIRVSTPRTTDKRDLGQRGLDNTARARRT